jgi:hypothetical protein
MRNGECDPLRKSIPPLALTRTKKNSSNSPPAIPPFRLFANRDVQRQDGASDPTDDAEKKDENEGDEYTRRHRLASVCLNSQAGCG